ncbi:MAG: hypothetical protein IPM29_10545 [Planctomycetes bacterium]|nr:hypothetical protein [Planctomycetota bacterium]
MVTRRVGGVVVGALVVGIVIALVMRGRQHAPPSPPDPGGIPSRINDSGVAAPHDPVRRPVTPGVRRIHVAAPAGASIAWLSGPDPVELHRDHLAPGWTPIDAAVVDGAQCGFDAREDHWLWVCASADADGGGGWVAYARCPPGVGERTVTLRRPTQNTIWALVLTDDLRRPAAGCDLLAQQPDGIAVSARTDDHGFVEVEASGPGLLTLGLEGGEPVAERPSAFRVGSAPGLSTTSWVATLVRPCPGEQVSVNLVVMGSGECPRALFATSVEPPYDAHPLTTRLRPGPQDLRVRLPLGSYSLGVLPSGAARLLPETPLAVVPDRDNEWEIRVFTEVPYTTLTLDGVTPHDTPFTVQARRPGAMVGVGDENLFLGPQRWQRLTERASELPEPVILEVRGKRRAWRSRGSVTLRGPETRVLLEEARSVDVLWQMGRGQGPGPYVVTLEGGTGDAIVVWAREELARVDGQLRRVCRATAVVGTAELTIACMDRNGAESWRAVAPAGSSGVHLMVGPELHPVVTIRG